MHPPPAHSLCRRAALAPLVLLVLVAMADSWRRALSQLNSYSTSETRIESAPLQVQAVFDNTSKVSITTSGVIGLSSPWAGMPVDVSRQGGLSPNFYDPSGNIQANLEATNGPCLNAGAFSAACAEPMPILRYEAGVPSLADYYAIINPSSSFNLSISTVNPDQPSSLSVIRSPEGTVLIPNTQPGASRYQVTVPGGTGMVITKDEQGGLLLDASKATAGASAQLSMVSVATSPDQTTITQSTAQVNLDPPTAMVEANRVNLIRAAGANVTAIGRGCSLDTQGNPSGSGCTVGILATIERFQVWDPAKSQPVQLIRPRLLNADYVKADPTLLHSTTSLASLRSDTNQQFATNCATSSGECRYVVEINQDSQGHTHSTVIPINELPVADPSLTTVMLPSYSTQSFNAGGVAGEGLGAVLRSADGSGNGILNSGIGSTTRLETTTTVIMRQ